MSIALLINASPYGSKLPYNALHLAAALELAGEQVELLLMGDAVNIARRGQDPRAAHVSLEALLGELLEKGTGVTLCGTCCQTRGLAEAGLADRVTVGAIHDFVRVVQASAKVLGF